METEASAGGKLRPGLSDKSHVKRCLVAEAVRSGKSVGTHTGRRDFNGRRLDDRKTGEMEEFFMTF